MGKKTDIKKKILIKYMTIMIISSLLCMIIGVNLVKSLIVSNSEILLSNFAKEVGKNISKIIELEIQNVEMIADTPILKNDEASSEEKIAYLSEIVEQYGYKKAALIDLQGNCKTINGEEVNVADKDYFQANMQGKSFLTAPYHSKIDGGLQIAITTPIIKENKVLGILFFSKEAEVFSEITNGISFGETGTAYVVDEQGYNIINRDINKVVQRVNRIEDAKTNSDFKELGAITEKMIAGEYGTGSYMFNGERKFLGYAPIEAKGWAVGVTVELKDMLSGVPQVKLYMILFIFGVTLLLAIIIGRVLKDYSARLQGVKSELDDIINGDLTQKKKHYVIMDEISEIDHTLQLAKASLKDMIETMNQRYEK